MRFRLSKFCTALPDADYRQAYGTRFKPCGSRFYAALPDADYRQMYGTRTVGNGLARSVCRKSVMQGVTDCHAIVRDGSQ